MRPHYVRATETTEMYSPSNYDAAKWNLSYVLLAKYITINGYSTDIRSMNPSRSDLDIPDERSHVPV